jgi:hypothetical protein
VEWTCSAEHGKSGRRAAKKTATNLANAGSNQVQYTSVSSPAFHFNALVISIWNSSVTRNLECTRLMVWTAYASVRRAGLGLRVQPLSRSGSDGKQPGNPADQISLYQWEQVEVWYMDYRLV